MSSMIFVRSWSLHTARKMTSLMLLGNFPQDCLHPLSKHIWDVLNIKCNICWHNEMCKSKYAVVCTVIILETLVLCKWETSEVWLWRAWTFSCFLRLIWGYSVQVCSHEILHPQNSNWGTCPLRMAKRVAIASGVCTFLADWVQERNLW